MTEPETGRCTLDEKRSWPWFEDSRARDRGDFSEFFRVTVPDRCELGRDSRSRNPRLMLYGGWLSGKVREPSSFSPFLKTLHMKMGGSSCAGFSISHGISKGEERGGALRHRMEMGKGTRGPWAAQTTPERGPGGSEGGRGSKRQVPVLYLRSGYGKIANRDRSPSATRRYDPPAHIRYKGEHSEAPRRRSGTEVIDEKRLTTRRSNVYLASMNIYRRQPGHRFWEFPGLNTKQGCLNKPTSTSPRSTLFSTAKNTRSARAELFRILSGGS